MKAKEIIEELLNKLQKGEYCQKDCYGCCGNDKIDITCKTVVDNFQKELLKHYQLKLPEDSVVLSKEEYDCLKKIEKPYDPFWFCSFGGCEGVCKECKDTCEMSIFVKERSETANKLIKLVYATLTDRKVWNAMHQWWLEGKECPPLKALLNEIAKQVGVEIKEN